jgi:hypothetical protein
MFSQKEKQMQQVTEQSIMPTGNETADAPLLPEHEQVEDEAGKAQQIRNFVAFCDCV